MGFVTFIRTATMSTGKLWRPGDQEGAEYGTYTYDASTQFLTSRAIADGNGSMGLTGSAGASIGGGAYRFTVAISMTCWWKTDISFNG